MRRLIGLHDIAVLVVITAAAHWFTGSPWTLVDFFSRLGFVMAFALPATWLWRLAFETRR